MPEDLYGDGGDMTGTMNGAESTPEQGAEAPPEEKGGSEDEGHGKPQLLNSEICPGLKPGDSLVLKVTGVKDGEYVVEYEAEPTEKEDRSAPMDESTGGANPGPDGYE